MVVTLEVKRLPLGCHFQNLCSREDGGAHLRFTDGNAQADGTLTFLLVLPEIDFGFDQGVTEVGIFQVT